MAKSSMLESVIVELLTFHFAQYKINRAYNSYQIGYHYAFGYFGQYR